MTARRRSARRPPSRALAAAVAAALAAALAAGCGGELADLGLDEPIRVRGGAFRPEPLPGLPAEDGAPATSPAITLVETASNVVRLGQANKLFAGRASTDAVAVGVALDGLGTGHWVAPLGPPDPTAGDELTWSLDTSLAWDLPLGDQRLHVVAIDAAGTAGRQYPVSLCVRPDLLDNASTCDPTRAPPDAVLALAWDTDVDLDLLVRTPDGKLVGPSHPSTIPHGPPITQAELDADGVGILDRDSNAGCRIDGINREALVWRTAPVEGTYIVYANLADACGQLSVRFTATLYRASPAGDGTSQLVEVTRQEGRLLANAADGGRGPGLFLLQLAL